MVITEVVVSAARRMVAPIPAPIILVPVVTTMLFRVYVYGPRRIVTGFPLKVMNP